MLSPREDDDDDSHLCIKCNTTIVGLDNYVKHRKQRCGKLKPEHPKPELPAIDPLEPSYNLGADVFFQSLELQSSVKKTSLSRLTPPIPISKANLNRKSSLLVPSTSRELPRMSPLETNLRGEDWIGGHSLRIGSNEDNQTKLINAVASISGAVKKDIPTSSYSINYDYKGDEDSDESEESEDDDEEEHPSGSKWKPPPNYTGGKWRPASPEHEDWDMREEQEHTGGKWKPIMPDNNERDEDYDAPPPGHTKGKWVPGANEKTQIMQTTIQTKGSVQYWCGPCNRRLNSRAIYDKHLRSSLHLKKVLPEHELEFSGHLEPMKNVVDKRLARPSRFVNDDIYSQMERKKQDNIERKLNIKIEKKKRKRKPNFVHCSGCKSRVRQHLMGKHLISHYHFRKATDTNTTLYQQLILDNMDAIVHQSPFQCSPCKFYTNWLSTFMQHWFSEEHNQKLSAIEGRLWCSFCKFDTESSQEMLDHLSSSDHSEVVAVINRSMPIIIRKKTVLKCDACCQEFKYNIEMKRHCQKTGHPLAVTATDNYQELHKCQHCKAKFKSSLTLAAHLKSKHKQRAYLCLVCSMNFNSSEEAKHHRQTSEHRIRRKENLREQGVPTKDMSKKCPYCTDNVILRNVLVLKDHIRRVHPNIRKKCPKCGMSFILSQEVTRHVRDNACQLSQTAQISSSIFWNCSQCLFTTDSQAECFFHEVLHTTPKKELLKVGDTEKLVQKYPCPLCTKSFKKASLRQHLRQHTFERPFICSTCGANFTRQTSLANHSRNEHSTEVAKIPKLPAIVERTEEWECGKCKTRFSSKTALSRHSSTCANATTPRQCPHDQCTFVASNSSQLAKNNGIPPLHQLLLALRFYALGTMLKSVADFAGVSQSSACRIVADISAALAKLYSKYINLHSRSTHNFYKIAQFPRVCGAVGCTHVPIHCPGTTIGEEYRNSKGHFSFNVQAVCDADLKLLNVVSQWPGSTHESTIFDNSVLRAQCDDGILGNCWLLGDNAYPNRPYLLTPVLNPSSTQEIRYNEAHMQTRRSIERHRRTHGEHIKHHECHLCTFKTDQASHMKRHMLCHQGVKPYGCPHCSFTCGSLENLRKHVLRSGRHPGLYLYHCRLCPYNTNTAMELRAHLTMAHAHKYDSKTAVEAVKIHLMIYDKK